ncbi:MAG: 5-(carboxyamino)imidazole ribonucleotide synthase [Myxococcales bacterium]|nr:5-(carboxyamino)imidazole ribonucleotide synthase [Myxococcales bacterium]
MRVGVLGAGQLGRMLALAGYPLGLEFCFLDPTPASPAGALAPQLAAPWNDPEALARLAECDVVTFEFENVPVETVESLSTKVRVHPSALALGVAQDRLREKTTFQELGIPTAKFMAVDDAAGLESALATIGLPAVLKTRRLGYDGKGQRVLRGPDDVAEAMAALSGTPLILESLVPFTRELSAIAVRSRSGETRFYPLVENEHEAGILRLSRAPAPGLDRGLQVMAEGYALRLLERLDYVGVLALELFDVDGTLYANEIAPRVHNSGHWTIEGARTSQFENHLRAVCDLPLGDASALGPSAMLNLIGRVPPAAQLLAIPDLHLHDYGKTPRDGRKVGHLTLRAESDATLEAAITRARALIDSG